MNRVFVEGCSAIPIVDSSFLINLFLIDLFLLTLLNFKQFDKYTRSLLVLLFVDQELVEGWEQFVKILDTRTIASWPSPSSIVVFILFNISAWKKTNPIAPFSNTTLLKLYKARTTN